MDKVSGDIAKITQACLVAKNAGKLIDNVIS